MKLGFLETICVYGIHYLRVKSVQSHVFGLMVTIFFHFYKIFPSITCADPIDAVSSKGCSATKTTPVASVNLLTCFNEVFLELHKANKEGSAGMLLSGTKNHQS